MRGSFFVVVFFKILASHKMETISMSTDGVVVPIRNRASEIARRLIEIGDLIESRMATDSIYDLLESNMATDFYDFLKTMATDSIYDLLESSMAINREMVRSLLRKRLRSRDKLHVHCIMESCKLLQLLHSELVTGDVGVSPVLCRLDRGELHVPRHETRGLTMDSLLPETESKCTKYYSMWINYYNYYYFFCRLRTYC